MHSEHREDDQTGVRVFEDFYRSHHDRTYRALGLALRNTTLAREATDETMARALERWDKIGHYDFPEQWVFRVGLNWAISRLRRQRYETLAILVEPSTEDGLPDPAVATALATLPVKLRAVVVARLYLDWSTEWTGQALRIRTGTVKSHLSGALTRLGKELRVTDIEQRVRATLHAEGEGLPTVATRMIPAVPPPTKSRTLAVVVTAFLVVLGLSAIAAALLPSSEGDDAAVTATISVDIVRPLSPVQIGEALLYYPTLLPSDLDLCSELVDPRTMRVIVCNGTSTPERTLKIDVKRSYPRGPAGYAPLNDPVPDRRGWTTTAGARTIVNIPVSDVWYLRVDASGMKLEEIVGIMDSLPIIKNRDMLIGSVAPEKRIVLKDVDAATLRSLVASEQDVIVYNTNPDQALIVIDNTTAWRALISINPVEPLDSEELTLGEPSVLVDLAGQLEYTRLAEGVDRPVLVGEIDGETQLAWVQGNLLWTFAVVQNPTDATARVIALMDQIQRILIDDG